MRGMLGIGVRSRESRVGVGSRESGKGTRVGNDVRDVASRAGVPPFGSGSRRTEA